jgi:hypothetical protein
MESSESSAAFNACCPGSGPKHVLSLHRRACFLKCLRYEAALFVLAVSAGARLFSRRYARFGRVWRKVRVRLRRFGVARWLRDGGRLPAAKCSGARFGARARRLALQNGSMRGAAAYTLLFGFDNTVDQTGGRLEVVTGLIGKSPIKSRIDPAVEK